MPYQLWTPQEETRLRELVSTGKHSYRQIGAMMGRGINSVTCHARQYLDINNDKYDKRKYHHDESFFSTPNLVNSYVAGFLAADGNISKTPAGYRVRLEVALEDENHLAQLKSLLGHDGPLHRWGDRNTKFFCVHVSDQYANDMATNFGLIPNKTHRLNPPNLLSFDLKFAYLLGLLDGDGCVHVSKQNTLSVSYVSSSLTAVEWLKQMMDTMNFPSRQRNTLVPAIRLLSHAKAHALVYNGGRAVCLVQLAQEFAARYNLPVLARKWSSPKVVQYIADFYARFPSFEFDPKMKLDELTAQSLTTP